MLQAVSDEETEQLFKRGLRYGSTASEDGGAKQAAVPRT